MQSELQSVTQLSIYFFSLQGPHVIHMHLQTGPDSLHAVIPVSI